MVASKDGSSLWVTNEAGSLFVYDLRNPDDSDPIEFKPDDMNDRDTECRSSVSLFETENGVQYGVFAVIDVPSVEAAETPISRYVAYFLNDHCSFSLVIFGVQHWLTSLSLSFPLRVVVLLLLMAIGVRLGLLGGNAKLRALPLERPS